MKSSALKYLFFIIIFSPFWIKTSEATDISSCINDLEERFPQKNSNGSYAYPYAKTINFLNRCFIDFAKEYKSSYNLIEIKEEMSPDEHPIRQTLGYLRRGVYSTDTDKNVLQSLKNFSNLAYGRCYTHPTYKPYKDSNTLQSNEDNILLAFVNTCKILKKLKEMKLSNYQPLKKTFDGYNSSQHETRCNQHQNPFSCALSCNDNTEIERADHRSAYCSDLTRLGEKGHLAIACVDDYYANNQNARNSVNCQKLCDKDPYSCPEGVKPSQGVTTASTDESSNDSQGGGGANAGLGGDDSKNPVNPINNAGDFLDDEITEDDANRLANMAQGLNPMMGMGMMGGMGMQGATNLPSSDPTSSVQARSDVMRAEARPHIQDATGSSHLPVSASLPPQTEGWPTGGRGKDSGGPGGGDSPGGGPMMGMGMMGGQQPPGAGGASNNRPPGGGGASGPRASALKPIADSLGGNNFMGAQGSPSQAQQQQDAAQGPDKKSSRDKQPIRRGDPRAKINAAFQRGLSGQGQQPQMQPNSYFPSVRGIYQNIYNRQDLIED